MLCYAMLCYVILFYVMSCYFMLDYIISHDIYCRNNMCLLYHDTFEMLEFSSQHSLHLLMLFSMHTSFYLSLFMMINGGDIQM